MMTDGRTCGADRNPWGNGLSIINLGNGVAVVLS
jgi:hypothetical protein